MYKQDKNRIESAVHTKLKELSIDDVSTGGTIEEAKEDPVAAVRKEIGKEHGQQTQEASGPPSYPLSRESSIGSICEGDCAVLDHKELSLVWTNHNRTDTELPNKIFVGSEKFARNRKGLTKFSIRAILNCTLATPNRYPNDKNIKYCNVHLADDDTQPIGKALPVAVDFLSNKVAGLNVLVHCTKGVSRSVAMFIGWLLASRRMPLREALMHVQLLRSSASPNMGFIKQLMIYERQQLNSTSLSVSDLVPCPLCLKVRYEWGQLSCGHRCCAQCCAEQPDDAQCAHCTYNETPDTSMEDLRLVTTVIVPLSEDLEVVE